MDVPHFEISPSMDTTRYHLMDQTLPNLSNNISTSKISSSSSTSRSSSLPAVNIDPKRLASINVHPRQEDINLAFKDLVLYRGWKRVAVLWTGLRDGDGSGASAFHLQHLLLHSDVDCLTRKLPDSFEVCIMMKNYCIVFLSYILLWFKVSEKISFGWNKRNV